MYMYIYDTKHTLKYPLGLVYKDAENCFNTPVTLFRKLQFQNGFMWHTTVAILSTHLSQYTM